MTRVSIKQLSFTVYSFLLFICLVMATSAQAGQPNKSFLTVQQESEQAGKKAASPLKLILSESPDGIKVDIFYLNKADSKSAVEEQFPSDHNIPEGGEVTLYLDGQLVSQEPFSGNELKLSQTLESMMVGNGDHTLRCEVNSYPGGQQKKEVSFHLDATPIIDVQTTEATKVFDPVLTFHLFGTMEGKAGFVEIHLDEQSVANFPLTPSDLDKPKKLSELLGKAPSTYGLFQGIHLMRITAVATNGSEAVMYLSFTVDAEPEVSITTDPGNKFKMISVNFPAVSSGYFGNVDVYYNQGVILAEQVKDPQFTLFRSAIEEAFKKHNHTIAEYPVDLVIAVRAGNGTEKWTRIEYR